MPSTHSSRSGLKGKSFEPGDRISSTVSRRTRRLAVFQPHGYGPLRQMGRELAETFARELGADDITILCDPVYFGGTVDRSEGSERIVRLIAEAGGQALHIPAREDCGAHIVQAARPGDRVVVMGARDDTLTSFARSILDQLERDIR